MLHLGKYWGVTMKTFGNIIWFLTVGLLGGLSWFFVGCIWCMTILGIPIGLQCFKFAKLAFFPFGKVIVYGGDSINMIGNILWLIFSGLYMAIGYTIIGLVLYITIIGIPFGKQCIKLAKLSLMPFGARIVEV